MACTSADNTFVECRTKPPNVCFLPSNVHSHTHPERAHAPTKAHSKHTIAQALQKTCKENTRKSRCIEHAPPLWLPTTSKLVLAQKAAHMLILLSERHVRRGLKRL